MLSHQFDFTVAKFDSLKQVDKDEVVQADIVEIREKVDGGIYHSQEMIWGGNLSGIQNISEMIRSKKEVKALKENKEWFESQGYYFEIVPMTGKLFEEFFELYQRTTLMQERPQIFSLKEQILGKILINKPVFLIGMFKEKVLESGIVFSIKDQQAVVSFGAKKKFPDRRGGVGGVLEQMLISYSLEKGLSDISHGKAKNPVGLLSKAGVFEFKARYGFSAFPSGYWKTTFLLNPKIALSDLVFVTTIDDQISYIVVTDSTEKDVSKKYSTNEVEIIRRRSFEEFVETSKGFFLTSKQK